MSAQIDLYRVLGVSRDSEDVVIQAAFRALMRRYHPDTSSSADAEQKARAINHAYSILGDSTKRAAYDAELKNETRREPSSEAKAPPGSQTPPSRPPSPKPAGTGSSGDSSTSSGFSRMLVVGGLAVITLAAGAAFNSASQRSETQASEALSASAIENYENAADFIDDQTSAASTAAEGETNETEPAVDIFEAPQSLTTTPPEAISYSDIESEASRFAGILTKDGLIGAREFSTQCHSTVKSYPTWTGADRCAAFDFAAAYVDAKVALGAGNAPNGYFRFQRENQSDYYTSVGALPYTTSQRLMQIRRAVESAADEAMSAAVARIPETTQPTIGEEASRAVRKRITQPPTNTDAGS